MKKGENTMKKRLLSILLAAALLIVMYFFIMDVHMKKVFGTNGKD